MIELKKRDLILIGLVLLAAGGFFLWNMLTKDKAPPNYVRIHVGGEVYKTIPLTEKGSVLVEQENGGVNEVLISDTGVSMHSANCHNQDCVKMGEITLENYETRHLFNWIVCLPNQVSIELVVEDTI